MRVLVVRAAETTRCDNNHDGRHQRVALTTADNVIHVQRASEY